MVVEAERSLFPIIKETGDTGRVLCPGAPQGPALIILASQATSVPSSRKYHPPPTSFLVQFSRQVWVMDQNWQVIWNELAILSGKEARAKWWLGRWRPSGWWWGSWTDCGTKSLWSWVAVLGAIAVLLSHSSLGVCPLLQGLDPVQCGPRPWSIITVA